MSEAAWDAKSNIYLPGFCNRLLSLPTTSCRFASHHPWRTKIEISKQNEIRSKYYHFYWDPALPSRLGTCPHHLQSPISSSPPLSNAPEILRPSPCLIVLLHKLLVVNFCLPKSVVKQISSDNVLAEGSAVLLGRCWWGWWGRSGINTAATAVSHFSLSESGYYETMHLSEIAMEDLLFEVAPYLVSVL